MHATAYLAARLGLLDAGAVPVPSYRLLVELYGTTVVLSRNFRPVSTSAMPVRPCEALYR